MCYLHRIVAPNPKNDSICGCVLHLRVNLGCAGWKPAYITANHLLYNYRSLKVRHNNSHKNWKAF